MPMPSEAHPGSFTADEAKPPNPIVMSEISDSELIARILQGDSRAAAHLLSVRCGPALKYLCQVKYRTLGLELDELVSEVFLSLRRHDWKALREFRGANGTGKSCSITSYVVCIASRVLWKKMGKAVKESVWLVPLDEIERQKQPDDAEERRRQYAQLLEAVMALDNPSDRLALMLYKIEGREVEEVARIMETTPGNIYTRCSRALRRLRVLLDGEGSHA